MHFLAASRHPNNKDALIEKKTTIQNEVDIKSVCRNKRKLLVSPSPTLILVRLMKGKKLIHTYI